MPIPVLTVAQMRAWEKATWATGLKEDFVMRRAGQAVARVAERLTRPGDTVLFLAGKGHNGEDTVFAHESVQGRRKELLRVTEPAAASPQLAPLLERRPALIVDGLFGIGLNRPLSDDWVLLLEHIHTTGRPMLAVDVPSGLDADTGLALGGAVRAAHTLTLGAVKRGLLQPSAVPFVGQLEVASDIGLIPCPPAGEWQSIDASDFRDFPPRRPVSAHKGEFGHLAILAGSRGFHGAAVLAARGAQRAQPGLVTLCVPEAIYAPVAAQLQATMVQPWAGQPVFPGKATALLVGPGLAAPDPDLRDLVRRLWEGSPLPVIVDASALDWLSPGAPRTDAPRVITPHPGEAARMLGIDTDAVQADRPAALRALSQKFGDCHVVLKGHQTWIGRAKGECAVNLSGNPHMAQGGSGDLLAGYLAGLLAQPLLRDAVTRVLRYAVWQHGAAADRLLAEKRNFTIEDLAAILGEVGSVPG